MDAHGETLRKLIAEHNPTDLVKVRALRHCSGQTPPGPDRETVVLEAGKTEKVQWFVARRWLAKKWAELPAPSAAVPPRAAREPIKKKAAASAVA